MAVTCCLPLADIGFDLLWKFFVPGSNPASARLLTVLGRLNFARDGEVTLAVPVGDLQAALSDCRKQGVAVDWDRAYRLLVVALSEAGSLRLELPSDGRTLSWSTLARTHADSVLGRGPTSPFPAESMESLLGELTEFARAQSLTELTFANARGSLRGLSLESVNRVGPAGASSGGESREKVENSWRCEGPECGRWNRSEHTVCYNKACKALRGDALICSFCHLASPPTCKACRHADVGCSGTMASMLDGAAARAARATLESNLARVRTGPSPVRRAGSGHEVALVPAAGALVGTDDADYQDRGRGYSEPGGYGPGARGSGGPYGGGRFSGEGHGAAEAYWGGPEGSYGFAPAPPEGGGELGGSFSFAPGPPEGGGRAR